ncbi:MAG: hypothetical protein H7Z42_19580, partial [Roseiflexaceae bacterium]|nr:hypothetical protein [Roseiflexaceae bacterium]
MLAQWLTQHRARLLPEWTARLQLAISQPQAGLHNGHGDTNGVVVAAPEERDLLMVSLYDGIILAAEGDAAPLDQCLRLMHALRTSDRDEELGERLQLAFQLRRVVWDGLFADSAVAEQRRELLEAAEQIFEHVTLALTEHWTTSAAVIRQQLEHAEQFAQTLAQAAEQADQITLQLHNLNTLASELATSLDSAALIETAGSKLHEVLGVAHVAIWLADDQGALAVAQSWGERDQCGLRLTD